MLRQMSRARRFNRWMADTISPFIAGDVLEIGAGIGNLTEFLASARSRYVATDTHHDQLVELRSRLAFIPNLETAACDAADPRDFASLRNSFDTLICLNVLEHIADDAASLANIYSALRPQGKAVVLAPQGAGAFGSLDEVLEHKRRYSKRELEAKLSTAGFHIEKIIPFNRATYPGWILNARILRRRTLSTTQLRVFDLLVPLWRQVDAYLPWPPASLIAVAIKPHA